MIRFNELKIEDNYIIIDVQIEEEKYFKDMYIDSIVIDTQDTFIANGPSSKAIYTKIFNTNIHPVYEDKQCAPIKKEENVYTQSTDKHNRVRIYINGKDLNVDIHKTMFFVYVIAGGTPVADTPCRWDENKALHTLVDTQVLYNNMIQYVKELSKDCSTPDNFDFKPLVDETNAYHTLDIHFAYVGPGVEVAKSERTITVVCADATELDKLITAIKTATGVDAGAVS